MILAILDRLRIVVHINLCKMAQFFPRLTTIEQTSPSQKVKYENVYGHTGGKKTFKSYDEHMVNFWTYAFFAAW